MDDIVEKPINTEVGRPEYLTQARFIAEVLDAKEPLSLSQLAQNVSSELSLNQVSISPEVRKAFEGVDVGQIVEAMAGIGIEFARNAAKVIDANDHPYSSPWDRLGWSVRSLSDTKGEQAIMGIFVCGALGDQIRVIKAEDEYMRGSLDSIRERYDKLPPASSDENIDAKHVRKAYEEAIEMHESALIIDKPVMVEGADQKVVREGLELSYEKTKKLCDKRDWGKRWQK